MFCRILNTLYASKKFHQLITFRSLFFGAYIQFIFIIMQNKTERLWKKAFNFVKENNIINPKFIIIDLKLVVHDACGFI